MIVILGCGESGIGAALLAQKKSIPVFLSDAGKIKDEFRSILIEREIDFEEGGHHIVFDCQPQLVVKSPGIPDQSELIIDLKKRDIEIISEIEFAYRYCNGKIIAITGSNGKTTTTNLMAYLMERSGLDVVKVGNVGYSFARSVAEADHQYYVIEVSSFQLDGIVHFKPDIAIILNITPDHMDRYDYVFENYARSKFKISQNQSKNEALILYKDKAVLDYCEHNTLAAEIMWVSSEMDEDQQVFVNGEPSFSLKNSRLKGRHNAMNAACVSAAAHIIGLSDIQIQEGINSFVNDAHRLEWIDKLNGVDYINDSKATNVDSVYWAMDAMNSKIIWIAGGLDKGNNYELLDELVQAKVKALVALGKDNTKLLAYYKSKLPVSDTHDMKTAVKVASQLANLGDVVLFSPACASFDLFNNYMHRGDEFKSEVQKLKAGL